MNYQLAGALASTVLGASPRAWAATVGLLISLACGKQEPGSQEITHLVGTASEYSALPRFEVVSIVPMCEASLSCDVAAVPAASTATDRWLVVTVSDNRRPQLRRFDLLTGTSIPIGGAGSGPGEYGVLMALSIDSSGRVGALDILQQRTILFDSTGSFERDIRIQIPPGYIAGWITKDAAHFVAAGRSGPSRDSSFTALYSFDFAGGGLEKNVDLPFIARVWQLSDMRPLPAAFAAENQWARSPQGRILFSSGVDFETHSIDPGAGSHSLFGFDITPRAVTAVDLERSLARRVAGISNPAMRNAIERGQSNAAAQHPAITRLVTVANENVWIRESPREAGDSVRWTKFDAASGAAAGYLMLATNDEILAATGDRVLVMHGAQGGTPPFEWLRLDSPD